MVKGKWCRKFYKEQGKCTVDRRPNTVISELFFDIETLEEKASRVKEVEDAHATMKKQAEEAAVKQKLVQALQTYSATNMCIFGQLIGPFNVGISNV